MGLINTRYTIHSTDIADGAVTNAKMADNAIGTVEVIDLAITENKLEANVTTRIKTSRLIGMFIS